MAGLVIHATRRIGDLMPAPPGSSDLTGATRYRNGWRGVLVLQVEEKFIAYWQGRLAPGVQRTPIMDTKWRDATVKDMRMLDYLSRRDSPPSPKKA